MFLSLRKGPYKGRWVRDLWLAVLTCSCAPVATHQSAPVSDGNPPSRYLAICDSGQFAVVMGDSTVGREAFTISCEMSETFVRVRSTSTLGIRSELQTELVLDKSLRPKRLTETGWLGSASVVDTLTWSGDTAALLRGGRIQVIPVNDGASFVGANFHTGLWLAIARYDLARGGHQTIPVFPKETLQVEAISIDSVGGVRPKNPAHPGLQALDVKLAQTSAIAWLDSQDRPVALTYALSGLRVIREGAEFAGAVSHIARSGDPLLGKTLSRDSVYQPARVEQVSFPSSDRELAGTLLMPNGPGPFAAVILISGSGALNRDGVLNIGGLSDYRPLRDLADAVVECGIAVLRFDNAGTGKSTMAGGQTTWDRMHDVMAGVASLRARPEIDPSRIGLVGHSEGGLVALMVAAHDSNLRALVLLASPGTRGDTLLRAQLEEHLASVQNFSELAKDSARSVQDSIFRSLRSSRSASDGALDWLRSFIDLSPATFTSQIRAPVLIVQGGRDRQVPISNSTALARLLSRGRTGADVTTIVIDSLNHLFLPAPTGRVAEYSSLPVHRLGADVLGPVRQWLRDRLRTDKVGH